MTQKFLKKNQGKKNIVNKLFNYCMLSYIKIDIYFMFFIIYKKHKLKAINGFDS